MDFFTFDGFRFDDFFAVVRSESRDIRGATLSYREGRLIFVSVYLASLISNIDHTVHAFYKMLSFFQNLKIFKALHQNK